VGWRYIPEGDEPRVYAFQVTATGDRYMAIFAGKSMLLEFELSSDGKELTFDGVPMKKRT